MPRPPTKAQGVAEAIAAQIDGGILKEGAWLPSERDLATTHQADRSTIRRALRILQTRGLIALQPGVGAQVGEPVRRDAADVTRRTGNWRGFHVSAEQAGRQPYTHTTVQEIELGSLPARWLGVPTGTRVLERARVQGVNDEPPVQLSTTWFAPEVAQRLPILKQVDTGPGGMLSRMEEAGYQLRFEDTITCRLPSPTEREQLQLRADQPVLSVWRRCYDQHGRILEATYRIVVGDRHELIYRYDAAT
jgi:GntR family transcriptional regulator